MSENPKFLNFPLSLLAGTITDPASGLAAISSHVFVSFAENCTRDFEAAFVQLAYLATRNYKTLFPCTIKAFLERADVGEVVEGIEEAWTGDGDFIAGAEGLVHFALLHGLPVTDHEEQAVIKFVALRDAAAFFGRSILDFDLVTKKAATAQRSVSEHEAQHGKDALASVPRDFFFDVKDSGKTTDNMRLFRCVCAVRSLVGKKTFTGVTKDMLRSRMVGAKSPSAAHELARNNSILAEELDALGSRKRFDRILTLGAVRGFYGKIGVGRRIYLSTKIKDPVALMARVRTRFDKLADYQAREQAARRRPTNKGGTLIKR